MFSDYFSVLEVLGLSHVLKPLVARWCDNATVGHPCIIVKYLSTRSLWFQHHELLRDRPRTPLTLPMLRLLLSKAQEANIFENDLNPVMFVFIKKFSLSTLQ